MNIIPAILARNKKEFNEQLENVQSISKNIQIDFADGRFVNSKTLVLNKIPDLNKYKNNFEAHLMVKDPEKYFSQLKKKGFKKIIFHYEAIKKPEEIISKARSLKLETWLAINPETEIKKILPYLNLIDGILIMGVRPGKSGQRFIPLTISKIKQLRKLNKEIKLQIDGGVNFKIARKLKNLGVNNINSGTLITKSENPREILKKLETCI